MNNCLIWWLMKAVEKQRGGVVESKAFAASPPLPSRTRHQPTPAASPQKKTAAEAPAVRALESRSEGIGGNRTKTSAVVAAGMVDYRHLPSNDNSVQRSKAALPELPTSTRLTADTKRSGVYITVNAQINAQLPISCIRIIQFGLDACFCICFFVGVVPILFVSLKKFLCFWLLFVPKKLLSPQFY